MQSVDLTHEVPQDFLTRYPALWKHAKSAYFWAPIQSLQVDGERRSKADFAFGNALISTTGVFCAFAGQRNLLQTLGWAWFERTKLDEVVVSFEFDFQQACVIVCFSIDDGTTEVRCKVNMRPGEPGYCDASRLPNFPSERRSGETLFRLPLRVAKFWRDRESTRTKTVLVGRGSQSTVLQSWIAKADKHEETVLPDDGYLGTIVTPDSKTDVWWNDVGLFCLTLPGELQSWLETKLPPKSMVRLADESANSYPKLVDVRGVVQDTVLELQSCVCIPQEPRGSTKLIDRSGKTYFLPSGVRHHEVEAALVFVSDDERICIALNSPEHDAQQLAKHLSVGCDDYPFSEGEYLMFVEPLETGDDDESNDMPALVGLEGLHFKSRVSPWNFDVHAVEIDRQKDSRYWIRTDEGIVLKAKVAPSDDLRLRRSIMHTRVIEKLETGVGMAKLFGILNELQVSRCMQLLFGDLLILFQEMEKAPGPEQLLQELHAVEEGVKLNKELSSQILVKLVLLAESLPSLKRQLEELGTFYPYHVRQSDDDWLMSAFGEPVANQWRVHRGQSEVVRLRSFVRTTQGNLWRSLTEIERDLARVEPVYSERLKSARLNAANRQYFATGAIGAAGLIGTGGFILPAIAAINLVNTLVSQYENNKQNQAMLIKHGSEVLRWWGVFVETFFVQVHESRSYLAHHFDCQAKRDCELFKKIAAKDRAQFLEHLQQELQKRIRSESVNRFEFLRDGESQIRQDLIESLHKIADDGFRGVLDRKSITDVQRIGP